MKVKLQIRSPPHAQSTNPTRKSISFVGSVKIDTKEKLHVATESLSFDQATGVAHTDAALSFNRENVSGTATGAVVEQKAKRLELKKDVAIKVEPQTNGAPKSSARARPVTVRSAHATFDHASLKLTFGGGATLEQERDILSGENIYATLNQQQRLEKAEIRGNSYLRTMQPGRAAEVHAVDMDFFLDKDQRLERAFANKDVKARSLDADSDFDLSGSSTLEVWFQATADTSLLKQMNAGGRSVVTLSAPKSKAGDPRAANKRLTADSVKLSWRGSGRDLEKAEASGNAELFIEPVTSSASVERRQLNAPQFDCDFFETGNLARSCKAAGGSKAVMTPVQPSPKRGTRTLTSQTMTTIFVRDTQDIERVDAQGDGKFNENDRNGVAANVSYVAADETVRLRGGDPTVWDSRGRTKAVELDSDLKNSVSYARNRVATTYYSQEQTNGATPFTKTKSPVYISSDRGEFRHESGQGIYTGNARAWQDDNFVRGDKLVVYVNDKRMEAVRSRANRNLQFQTARRKQHRRRAGLCFRRFDVLLRSGSDHPLRRQRRYQTGNRSSDGRRRGCLSRERLERDGEDDRAARRGPDPAEQKRYRRLGRIHGCQRSRGFEGQSGTC